MTHHHIIEAVAAEFGCTVFAIHGHKRTQPIATARQVAYYLVQKHLNLSSPETARIFGRVHGAILKGVERVKCRMETERQFAARVACLEHRIVQPK